RGRRAPQARAADRGRLRRPCRAAGAAAGAGGPPPPPGVSPLDVEVLGGALPAGRVRRVCALAAATAGIEDGHLAVTFVTPDEIAALNAQHRGKDGPTDVLSFPVDGDGPIVGDRELGDVVICPEHTVDLDEAVVHG